MLTKMLTAAAALGFWFEATYDNDVDYAGDSIALTIEALEACDEMELRVRDADGTIVGWAFIVNGNGEDEQIADCSGWVSDWIDENE